MKQDILIFDLKACWLIGLGVLAIAATCNRGFAFERYRVNSSGGNCADCHGKFTEATSPKGTVFPGSSKHEMHQGNSQMNSACGLCHTSGDNRNPFIGSSTGTANNAGLGCSGCHVGPGLRRHHRANGIDLCGDCHNTDPATPPAENVKPPYYGTPDTLANNPCNGVAAAQTNENWSIGDFLGLDNDGNDRYDLADSACGTLQIVRIGLEGSNVRIVWDSSAGRTNVVQASRLVTGTYTNVSAPVVIGGTGIVRTNYLEVGGATNRPSRFYRLQAAP